MMRKTWGGLLAAIVVAGLVPLAGISAPESPADAVAPARLLAVQGLDGSASAALRVEASGPFSFTAYQPNPRGVIVDLAGVRAEALPGPQAGPDGARWVAHYRLLPFRNASGQHVLRLELNLTEACEVQVTQPQPAALEIGCPTAPALPASSPAAPPAVSQPHEPQSLPASQEPLRVSGIEVHRGPAGVTIEVKATGPLGYETLTLSNPTRLVVDLPDSVLVSRRRQFAVEQQGVVGVRVAQFKNAPPVTRLVVDMLDMVPYEIERTPDGLRLSLGDSAPATQGAVAAEEKTAGPRALHSEPAPREEVEQEDISEPAPVLLASLAPMVPSGLSPAMAMTALEAEEEAVDPAPMASNLAPVLVEPTPVPAVGAPAVQGQMETVETKPITQYTGEPISVDLKNVDLKDFFRLIHEISGLNIIVDPNVRGTVTMVLIDVPWDQALDIVLKNNGLGATLEGNVLRIATLGTLKKEAEEQRDLARARAEAVDPVVVTRELSYAQANQMEPTLRRFLSSRGEIIRDDRTNTLIIRDIPTVIPEIDSLIQQLDRKSLQVEIEARIVSATRAFMREIGSQFATSFSSSGGRNIFGGALGPSPLNQGATGSPIPPPPLISAEGGEGTQSLASDFSDLAATSGFLFGHRSPDFALDVILLAAESRNIAKVLSKPRLVTQNNVLAEVKQGTRIPVQTVVNNTISTQFIDVVLRLEVTPQITAEGTVFLDINIENEAIDPGIARINGIPAIATQETTTQVLIADGGTVVVGGVMVTNNATNVAQVPLLGSIPIIGHLFKRSRVDTSTQELLFFITPRILPG